MTPEEEREEDFEESDGYVIIVIVQDANSIRHGTREILGDMTMMSR